MTVLTLANINNFRRATRSIASKRLIGISLNKRSVSEHLKLRIIVYRYKYYVKRNTLLNVQILHLQRVRLDERAAGFHYVAHQRGEDVVGGGSVFDGDLQQRAVVGVQRRFP